MKRPLCTACKKRPAAINCHRGDRVYYRSRCDSCIRKGRKQKPPVPRWTTSGYKKKAACDRCGFVARYQTQLLVYHIDGNLNNSTLTNLRTVCLNCSAELPKLDLTWKPGDLEADR